MTRSLILTALLTACAEPHGIRVGNLWCPPETRPVESAEYYAAECIADDQHRSEAA